MAEEPRRPLQPDEIPTVEDVVGKIPKDTGPSVVCQNFLRKVGLSSVVKASTSPCPITRNLAMNLADSRSLRVGPDANLRGVEIIIRSEINRLTNSVDSILAKTWKKVRQDKRPEFSKIREQEFFDAIGIAHWNKDISSNPYVQEAAQALRPIVDEMLKLWKEGDLGNRRAARLEHYEKEIAKWEGEVAIHEKKLADAPTFGITSLPFSLDVPL
jgi:hypothetical protein